MTKFKSLPTFGRGSSSSSYSSVTLPYVNLILTSSVIPRYKPYGGRLTTITAFLAYVDLRTCATQTREISSSKRSSVRTALFVLRVSSSPRSSACGTREKTLNRKDVTRSSRHEARLALLLTARRRRRVITNARRHVAAQRGLAFTAARAGGRAAEQPHGVARALSVHGHARLRERLRGTAAGVTQSLRALALHARVPFRRLTVSQLHARRVERRRHGGDGDHG